MERITIFRWLTLSGYFGLMITIFSWHLWIDPLPAEFISITLLIQLGPLMFPLRGILNGKAYTHAWASYMALFYMIVGVWYASAESTRAFGILISTFSMAFYTGAIFYARYQGQAQNQVHSSDDE